MLLVRNSKKKTVSTRGLVPSSELEPAQSSPTEKCPLMVLDETSSQDCVCVYRLSLIDFALTFFLVALFHLAQRQPDPISRSN